MPRGALRRAGVVPFELGDDTTARIIESLGDLAYLGTRALDFSGRQLWGSGPTLTAFVATRWQPPRSATGPPACVVTAASLSAPAAMAGGGHGAT